MPNNNTSGQNPAMRAERDRFVALAFCWADILLEVTTEEKIVFAAGPTQALTGKKPEDLVGMDLKDAVYEQDAALLHSLLGVARKKTRIENVDIRLRGPKGPTLPLSFAGYKLDDLQGHYFLAFRMAQSDKKGSTNLKRNSDSRLLEGESFAEVAGEKLKEAAAAGEDAKLTLIDIPGFETMAERLSEEEKKELLNTIGVYLRANSLDGDTAAQVGAGQYSLVHGREIDIKDLERQISDAATEADPKGEGVSVESATLDVDSAGSVSEEDLANSLLYTINRFKDSDKSKFSLHDLSANLSSLMSEATESVNVFKRIVTEKAFDVVFQPIIDVMTGEIHHYEALARFHKDGTTGHNVSPYETITFAEETGLIPDFDMAMATKVMEWLSTTPRNSKASVAVNVSGHSVANLNYVTGLDSLLKNHLWAKGRLLFEITESARMDDLMSANTFIQNLRSGGYEVCLDDFGAGAANFEYLSTLEIDVVKLDGPVIRNAMKAPKGAAFLKALASLCRELNVETIGEQIDDKEGLDFIRKAGLQYVQGYLFGKPSADIKAFAKHGKDHLFPSKKLSKF